MLPGFADINSPAAKTVYTTPETVAALAEHKQTIGFTALPAVANTRLKVLKVNGIYPSAENVLNGKYRLAVPFGIVYKGQPKGLAQKFIDFLYSKEGQEIIAATGAVPVE
jgi:phosphate transport system substrate-binding protein